MPAGPYSQAVVSGNKVFVSGQIPIDPNSGTMASGTEDQIRTAFGNLLGILRSAGADGILSTTVYLTDMDDFPAMNSIYSEMIGAPFPARTCIGVSSLPKGARIMVDAIGEIADH
jgi:2-iminobutanoate/2-iminopropanoate deaminase